jgi:glycosyltransferase involved in cell wall biosynthesis
MLTIGYSTLASRLKNIKLPNLSAYPEWEILITVQSGTNEPPILTNAPSGVEVLGFSGRGVTKIRNKVIENSKTKYLVFADDDIAFNLENLAKAVTHLEKSGAALLLGEAVDESGALRKNYPNKIQRLNKINSAKAATYEMVIDVEKVKSAGVRFDEEFGAGAEATYLGDEYIFICDLIDAGLKCEFVPLVLATHPKDSSGSGWGTEKDRIARAKIFDRAFKGNRTLPYLIRAAFGFRKLGSGLSLGNYLKFIFKR